MRCAAPQIGELAFQIFDALLLVVAFLLEALRHRAPVCDLGHQIVDLVSLCLEGTAGHGEGGDENIVGRRDRGALDLSLCGHMELGIGKKTGAESV